MGTLAHAELAGVMVDERPARLAYDTLTKSDHHAIIQAHHIATCARELMTAQGWGVLATEEEVRRDELVGHLDIRAWHSRARRGDHRPEDGAGRRRGVVAGGRVSRSLGLGGGIHLGAACLHVPRVRFTRT